MYIGVYTYISLSIYIYIYIIFTHTHTHIHTHINPKRGAWVRIAGSRGAPTLGRLTMTIHAIISMCINKDIYIYIYVQRDR